MSSANTQQYLGFVFTEAGVVAALWQQVSSRIQIIARSGLVPIENENWVETIDKSLEELGSKSLAIKKALFAVPTTWTSEGELIDEKRALLKGLTKDLLLEPLGFVLLEDTILAWQEEQLGESFTGTVITNTIASWTVQRVEDGQTLSIAEVGKSGDKSTDWNELKAQVSQLTSDHRRGIYLDFMPSTGEYDQIIVQLRQLLQTPVEKIRPDTLADIAIVQGAKEILADANVTPTGLTNDAIANEGTAQQTDGEFRPPEFVQATAFSHTDSSEILIEEAEIVEDESEAGVPKRRKFPHIRLPQISFGTLGVSKNKKLLLVLGSIVALFISAGGAYAWLSTQYTALITVELESKTLEMNETMTLEATASDSANLFTLLAPETLETTVTVTKEAPTTGTKITGDPAKGKVRLYNKTDDTKSFAAGTRLTLNGKIYKLDSDVQVASASSKEDTGSRTTEFGSLETTITASFIGPEGNIPKDQKFAVANFSSSTYEAVSLEEFTGGSSREIQAVAASDIQAAQTDLLQQARQQIEEEFATQNSTDQQIFFAGELSEPTTESSEQPGDEAKVVQVQTIVTGKAYRVSREALVLAATSLFASGIPEGYLVQESSIALSLQKMIPGSPPQAEVKLNAKAVPDIQPQHLFGLVSGQYKARAQTILEETHGVKAVNIAVKPQWLTSLFTAIPSDSERVRFNLLLK